ncbi:dolichol kinase [Anthonomus grandis grandis]|uniref:dolichol kinase n=1 Tax=Anthonomus grandis grandis TaxID=2921223 RepID=UPI0021655701|nr:dolichol kinase [Anthonomus grandis grandis]
MKYSENMDVFLVKNNFSARPSTGRGLWVLFLLPISLIISLIRHPITVTPTYKLATLVSFTLLCNSLYIVIKCFKREKLKILNTYSTFIAISTGCLFHVCLHKGWTFSILSGVVPTLMYLKVFSFLLTNLKESFTLGEAGLISQGLTIFVYSTFINVFRFGSRTTVKSNMQISTLIIQVGLCGILTLALLLYKFSIKNVKYFYVTTTIVLTATIIVPLHAILKQSPVLWIFQQVFDDVVLLKLFLYWSTCIAVAILAVSNQIYYAQKASTSSRKVFHILAVLVYIPGLYFKCAFLYLSTGVVLGVFLALEILRLLSIPPLGQGLQDGFVVFKDEKDGGPLALTPIYLLAGVSLPIWLHPSPCDVTDSAQFYILPLLSGLASIGIGDTAASYVGSKFGRFKWKGSSRTFEGTLACFVGQLAFFYFLHYIGFIPNATSEYVIKIVASSVVSSLVEAKTTQIDNLVLPLIMYIILS